MADNFNLPPFELLRMPPEGAITIDKLALERRARELEAAYASFDLSVEVIEVEQGPLFTAFGVELPAGRRVAELRSLLPDIARILSADRLWAEPLAGRPTIRIYFPNADRDAILLGELIASEAFEEVGGALPIVLGKSLSGELAGVDLAELQHLLVAGTTGTGKSTCLHGILLSLLFNRAPSELRLLLIDPKAVEFGIYNGIPHLLAPVLVEPEQITIALRWIVAKMDERIRQMAKFGVRSIDAFNARARVASSHGDQAVEPRLQPLPPLEQASYETPIPRIVIMIDVAADLMSGASIEVDRLLEQLARRGHVAGIHLILSAERAAVMTNLSSRLAFRTFSAGESRIILDERGAEDLAPQGDMLLKVAGSGLTRLHGATVNDTEIIEVADHWRREAGPDYVIDVAEEPEPPAVPQDDETRLYEHALSIVCTGRNASTSRLQRELRVGYNVAARLIETMQRRGVVSAPDHTGRREVYGIAVSGAPIDAQASRRPSSRWSWSR